MAKMIMLTETSEFMMGYVIITEKDQAVIVDGGREEDVPLLREAVGGRPIAAWFLTHPHLDHINGFLDVVREERPGFDIRRVYYHFPDVDFVEENATPDQIATSREFQELLPRLGERATVVRMGDRLTVDELTFEVLYHWERACGLCRNAVNDSSIVFRMTTPNTSVMFLGDLGPEGGDILFRLQKDNLSAHYCQMAHHGHMCVGPEVYMAIDPKVCLWNAPDWLWEEEAVPIGHRMYGEKLTRFWMERLGVRRHIVTKDGTAVIPL